MMLGRLAIFAALQAGAGGDQPRPLQPLASWFSAEDYPIEARKAEVEGVVRVRLGVDAGGAPTDCAIEQSAGPDLDAATCRILIARSRYDPARDARGNPVAGSFVSRIVWRLPPLPATLPFAPLRIADILEIGADGTVRCVGKEGGRPSPPGFEICGVALAMGLADSFRRNGRAARMTIVLAVMPDKQPEPPAPATEPGTLMHRSDARIVLAPGGHMSVCEETGSPRGSRRLRNATTICIAYLRGDGPDFDPVPAGARSGVITLSAYLADPPPR